MEWIALILWLLTAGGGLIMLGIYVMRGGTRQGREPGRRIPPWLPFTHFALAAGGLVVWIIYLINDSDALKWVAFFILLPVALLGWIMFAIWYQRRQRERRAAPATTGTAAGGATPAGGTAADAEGPTPAEQHFPVSIVTLHGISAVATVVFVFLTAIGVGD